MENTKKQYLMERMKREIEMDDFRTSIQKSLENKTVDEKIQWLNTEIEKLKK